MATAKDLKKGDIITKLGAFHLCGVVEAVFINGKIITVHYTALKNKKQFSREEVDNGVHSAKFNINTKIENILYK